MKTLYRGTVDLSMLFEEVNLLSFEIDMVLLFRLPCQADNRKSVDLVDSLLLDEQHTCCEQAVPSAIASMPVVSFTK